MIKVLIVEDEGVAARRLEKMLLQLDLEVQGHCDSIKSLQNYLSTHPEPDLYFLDIHLSDGLIFDFLQAQAVKAPIIFTTAYDQYAIKAFKQNSVDYLLKPFDVEDLKTAVDKYSRLHQQQASIDLRALGQLLKNQTPTYRQRIRVKIGDHLRSIAMDEVTHIYSEQKITFLHVAEGRAYPIDQSVDKIMQELDPDRYFRISRSHLVNIDYIEDVMSFSSSRLKISLVGVQGQDIVVSRDRVKSFKEWLG